MSSQGPLSVCLKFNYRNFVYPHFTLDALALLNFKNAHSLVYYMYLLNFVKRELMQKMLA